jgi:hypothetical protein
MSHEQENNFGYALHKLGIIPNGRFVGTREVKILRRRFEEVSDIEQADAVEIIVTSKGVEGGSMEMMILDPNDKNIVSFKDEGEIKRVDLNSALAKWYRANDGLKGTGMEYKVLYLKLSGGQNP